MTIETSTIRDPFLYLDSLFEDLKRINAKENSETSNQDEILVDEYTVDEFIAKVDVFFAWDEHQDYIKNSAAMDIMESYDLLDHFALTRSADHLNKSKSRPHIIRAAEHFFGMINTHVPNGNSLLCAMLARLRYGYTHMHLQKQPERVYEKLLQQAKLNETKLIGHLAMKQLIHQGVENILKHSNYKASDVELFSKYIPEKIMLKHACQSIKKLILANDLGM